MNDVIKELNIATSELIKINEDLSIEIFINDILRTNTVPYDEDRIRSNKKVESLKDAKRNLQEEVTRLTFDYLRGEGLL